MIKKKISNYNVTITITKTFVIPAYDKETAFNKVIKLGIDKTLKDAVYTTSIKKSENSNDNN
tara:strand:+ start:153 stop:338 length:186 start_codon:yes stop_codon:yes gene_type:complete